MLLTVFEGLYNAFLAPGSPCELNIDHSLRTALAARMTRAVGDDEATIASLDEVASLFDQAQTSVFKLMASVSLGNARDTYRLNC
jgi:GTPase-activating protein SST2